LFKVFRNFIYLICHLGLLIWTASKSFVFEKILQHGLPNGDKSFYGRAPCFRVRCRNF